METLALQSDFQEVNTYLLTCSRSANRVICSIRFDYEFKSRMLKRDAFDEAFGFLDTYKKHFRVMPEDPGLVEEMAWRLLHTAYWQAYYTFYGRQLPSRAEFHQHYFERLPGKQGIERSGKKAKKFYTVIPGYVYIIEAIGSGHVKIGRSTSAVIRLDSLATASPFPLKLLRHIKTPDASGLERQLHQRYIRFKVHREWYALPPDVLVDLLKEDFA
jgi:hypothetical protein